MVSVQLDQVTKSFGQVVAVDHVSLDVQPGELFFLLGPSGCGKSTLLRTIAGFCAPDSGKVLFSGKEVTNVPPHRRNTGMVFQNYALWPHMTVEDNVGYGLDVRKVGGAERAKRVRQALEMVRMADYGQRKPNQLSGGQQQRVAVARALVIQPDVVLLDEPLSNLDARLRLEMRDEIRRIHRDTGITTIYVTHDQKEALSMADRLAVIDHGRLIQVGTPQGVYRSPANLFVAQFIGETNLIRGKVAAKDGGVARISTALGEILSARPSAAKPGDGVVCSIRPEALQFACDQAGTGATRLRATVKRLTYLGEVQQYDLEGAGGQELRAVELNPGAPPSPGDGIELFVRPDDVAVFADMGDSQT